MKAMLFKFIKFCIVGFSGLIVDFATTWVLKEKLRTNKYLANSTGFILAVSSNYIFNRIWTFQSTNSSIALEFTSFFIVSLIGLLINNSILFITHEKLKREFYFSKLIAIFLTTAWNFLANYFYTFMN